MTQSPPDRMTPWATAQLRQLLTQKGHAWLLHGPSGLGQYSLALGLARAWLCDAPTGNGACGVCGSCHAIDVRTHADLCVLIPETIMLGLSWPLGEKAQSEVDDKKRKPSKEIRTDAMRDAVEFSQRTSARGRGKVILIFPAEQMNGIAANALLKTLEEPSGDVRFALASEAAHQLLPTIRSRCLAHTMHWPDTHASVQWLQEQGYDAIQSRLVLKATGGRPEGASGFDPTAWALFPKAMAAGDVGFVRSWSIAQLIDTQQKLCHDLMAVRVGGLPRFYEATDLHVSPPISSLSAWSRQLAIARQTMEHPFSAGLMQEALVGQAQSALNCALR
jgi:DNA polymerase-3 subunit delta'